MLRCFNNAIPRAQLFIISYCGFGFISAYNSIPFCCFRRNVKPWSVLHCRNTATLTGYHAWRLVVEYPHTRNKRKAGHKCDLQTTLQHWSQSQIFVENRDFSVPCLHSRPPLRGVPVKILPCRLVRKKTRIMGLPDCEKFLMMCLFVLTKLTNVTDGQADRQTPHDGKGRAWWSWSRAVEPRRRWLVITRGA